MWGLKVKSLTICLVASLILFGSPGLAQASSVYPAGVPVEDQFSYTPDPAAVATSATGSNAQLYFTGNLNNQTGGTNYIVTQMWTPGSVPSATPTIAIGPTSALQDWAPTVQFIQGQYVMWFSGLQSNNNPACVYSATAVTANGPFTAVNYWCVSGLGMLDPSIAFFQGYPNLLVSLQGSGTSYLYSYPLSLDGTQLSGNGGLMIAAYATLTTSAPKGGQGSPSELENPAADSYGDVFASYGSYKQANAYSTIDFPCTGLGGPSPSCNTSNAENIATTFSDGQAMTNEAGASLMESSSNAERYFAFASAPPGAWQPRTTWVIRNTLGLNPVDQPNIYTGESLTNGEKLVNYTTGWVLVMQSDGNLVLYAPGNVPKWSMGSSGDSAAYAVMQGDGNLVVYDNGRAIGSTNAGGHIPNTFDLVLQK